MGEKYPWLDDSDERKYMSHREILREIYKFRQYMLNRRRKEGSFGYVI